MATLNLDALRAEADMTPHEVTLGGKTYRFRARMPLEFAELLNAGKLAEAVKLLLVDGSEYEQFREAIPDDQDLLAITDLYAVDLPESGRSAPSSLNGGPSSKSTSNGSTPSTSPRRAGARRPSASAG